MNNYVQKMNKEEEANMNMEELKKIDLVKMAEMGELLKTAYNCFTNIYVSFIGHEPPIIEYWLYIEKDIYGQYHYSWESLCMAVVKLLKDKKEENER